MEDETCTGVTALRLVFGQTPGISKTELQFGIVMEAQNIFQFSSIRKLSQDDRTKGHLNMHNIRSS